MWRIMCEGAREFSTSDVRDKRRVFGNCGFTLLPSGYVMGGAGGRGGNSKCLRMRNAYGTWGLNPVGQPSAYKLSRVELRAKRARSGHALKVSFKLA